MTSTTRVPSKLRLTALASALALATCISGPPAWAGDQTTPAETSASSVATAPATQHSSSAFPELRAVLAATVPTMVIDEIRPSQIPGLYAVFTNHTVLYVDQSGKYVINGHIFDAASKADLTQDMLAEQTRIDPKILPLDDSFAEVRGNGKRQLYVFSDPDCPFCKELERELPQLTDVTIHVFLFPLVSIHPDSRTNAVAVWCSKDRSIAWQNKLLRDIAPPPGSCDNPVDRNLALAQKLGINGTPTLIFADGKRIAGTVPVERLDALLGPST